MEEKKSSNQFYFLKKWWFWAIVIFVILCCIFAPESEETQNNISNTSASTNNQIKENTNTTKKTYTLKGEELGEYGKKITLNKDSDMPVDKFLYKIPAGNYKVTTTNSKMTSFAIVKDTVKDTGEAPYNEALNYVSEQYLLTAGKNSFNGKAKKEIQVTINEDESIQIVGTDNLILEEY